MAEGLDGVKMKLRKVVMPLRPEDVHLIDEQRKTLLKKIERETFLEAAGRLKSPLVELLPPFGCSKMDAFVGTIQFFENVTMLPFSANRRLRGLHSLRWLKRLRARR
jgi:hypothetical protein